MLMVYVDDIKIIGNDAIEQTLSKFFAKECDIKTL